MRKYACDCYRKYITKSYSDLVEVGDNFLVLLRILEVVLVGLPGCTTRQVRILLLDKKSLSPRLLASNMHPKDSCDELLFLIELQKKLTYHTCTSHKHSPQRFSTL